MNVSEGLLYTKEHEWARVEGRIVTMGITGHAQAALGDITYVELPREGQEVSQFKQCAGVESVKAASDIYAPFSGRVVKVNGELSAHPELVNQSPYEKGWFAQIELKDPAERDKLMNAQQYKEYLEKLGG